MKTYCNPVDVTYRFYSRSHKVEKHGTAREGSDPAMIFYEGFYYLFLSKTSGYFISADMTDWKFIACDLIPKEGYGPEAWIYQGKLYYTIDSGDFLRAVDPRSGIWEHAVPEIMPHPDPAVYSAPDGRIYYYYGCSCCGPICADEVDPETFHPIPGTHREFLDLCQERYGWQRFGENNSDSPKERRTWNEGAYMIEHNGKYYLQNSLPGTEYNTYADEISVGDTPLGPFKRQADNPFSLKPGGFITGAGHSASFRDKYHNVFHLSTMRISVNYVYERRIGLFPAGFYEDGAMFCNQRFGDYPHFLPDKKVPFGTNLFTGWMLQSYRCKCTASSESEGHPASFAADENIRTHWTAGAQDELPALKMDLGHVCDARAFQVNFAEEYCTRFSEDGPDEGNRWYLEVSADDTAWKCIADFRENSSDRTHIYFSCPEGMPVRYVRLVITRTAAGGRASVSGLRVFGLDTLTPPPEKPVSFSVTRGASDMCRADFRWDLPENADGINILWGISPDRMTHCRQAQGITEDTMFSLDSEMKYYVCAEAFGRGGVSERTDCVMI